MQIEQRAQGQDAVKALERPRGPADIHVEPLLTPVAGAQKMLGLGSTTIWGLIANGELRIVRFGRRVMVEIGSVYELIEGRRVKAQERAAKSQAASTSAAENTPQSARTPRRKSAIAPVTAPEAL